MAHPVPAWRPEFVEDDVALVVGVDFAGMMDENADGFEMHCFVGNRLVEAMAAVAPERRMSIVFAILRTITQALVERFSVKIPFWMQCFMKL